MDEGKSVKTGVGERRGWMVGRREKKLEAAEGEEVGSGGGRWGWMVVRREKKLEAAEGEEVGSGGVRRSWKRGREKRFEGLGLEV